MKKIFVTLFLLELVIFSWLSDSIADSWSTQTAYTGVARWRGASFVNTATSRGYVLFGQEIGGTSGVDPVDLREFTPNTGSGTWATRASWPSASLGRWGGVAVAVGSLGYAGLGEDVSNNKLGDWKRYTPGPPGTWATRSALGTGGTDVRAFAVAFTDGTYAYVCSGFDGSGAVTGDLFRFDPGANTWATRTSMSTAKKRYFAVAGATATEAYVGLGNNGTSRLNDWNEYSFSGNSWATKTSFPGTARDGAFAFAIGYGIYVGGGLDNTSTTCADFYLFNATNNTWTAKTNWGNYASNSGGESQMAFSIGTLGYTVAGYGGSATGSETWKYTPDETLPIELTNFSATLDGEHPNEFVILNWQTLTETNNEYFKIERSKDGVNFEEIGDKIEGAGTSSIPHCYQTYDYNPLKGVSYYRLKQVDYDGTTVRFKVVAVNNIKNHKISIGEVYPNPSADIISITITTDESSPVFIKIFDAQGKKVANEMIEIQPGINSKNINVEHLSAGNYTIEAQMNNGLIKESKKFIKE